MQCCSDSSWVHPQLQPTLKVLGGVYRLRGLGGPDVSLEVSLEAPWSLHSSLYIVKSSYSKCFGDGRHQVRLANGAS
eukprot:5738549-Amphidinium_carterae.1